MFKVGDKVMCIDDKNWVLRPGYAKIYVEVGKIYTVREVHYSIQGEGILLEEVKNPVNKPYITPSNLVEPGFLSRRFIKIWDENVKIERTTKIKEKI